MHSPPVADAPEWPGYLNAARLVSWRPCRLPKGCQGNSTLRKWCPLEGENTEVEDKSWPWILLDNKKKGGGGHMGTKAGYPQGASAVSDRPGAEEM